ncbi:MAG: peptide ABC transporter substrate-binding protein [Candidatus Eremiobacteraeota bacterium]|nr:peptide ABC transporter substrate-binding protein [Candidatus Eremiobacteraeota bacterium]
MPIFDGWSRVPADRADSSMRQAIIATAFLALAACAPGSSGKPGEVRVFSVTQQREPRSLNPALENGQSSTEWGLLLFSYMVKYNAAGNLVGDAASKVPTLDNGGISKDGLTVTYHLRHGLRFADGKPLTAEDCVWSIRAINDPANNVQSRYGYDDVADANASDASTCVLHLKRPFAPLITLVLAPQGFPIFPKHVLARYPNFNQIDFDAKPLGSGPYVVSRWIRGDRVQMRANPYYFGGKPAIDRLTVRFVGDPRTAINLLRTDEAQGYFNEQDFGDYPLLQGLRGFRVTATPVAGLGSIIFNTQDSVTGDARVRHAIAEAMDIRSIIAKTYRGAVQSSGAGKGLFFWAYDAAAYPDVPYDPANARRLLERAGWKMGVDGTRHKDGRALNVLFIIQAATPGDAIIGNEVAQYERSVGVTVTLKQYNVTQFVSPASEGGPVYGGKFQMALYPFVNGDDPDTTDQFACANVPPKGYNKSRICDPVIDRLLAQGRSTFDIQRRKAIYAKLERVLYARLPVILMYQRRELDTFTDRLHNQTTSIESAWWNVGAWRVTR